MEDEKNELHDDEENDKVVEDIKDDLREPNLTIENLKDLEDRLEARIQVLSKDKSKDAEDKARLEGQIEKLSERIEHLIEAQEERDKKHNDESTIVIPPKELDPPTHQNPVEVRPENPSPSEMRKERKLKWW